MPICKNRAASLDACALEANRVLFEKFSRYAQSVGANYLRRGDVRNWRALSTLGRTRTNRPRAQCRNEHNARNGLAVRPPGLAFISGHYGRAFPRQGGRRSRSQDRQRQQCHGNHDELVGDCGRPLVPYGSRGSPRSGRLRISMPDVEKVGVLSRL
ncbi:MAG: hypothetical protein QOJ42_5621 [Acidobacteriaceae bacterium]|nr:hypothetical protein [Acidobacteriaceae bacterium]